MARIPLVPAAPNDGKSYVQSNGSWVETSAGVGVWDISKGYGTNDPVQYTDGVVYKAKQWIPPGTAWNITLWEPVSGSAAGTLGGFVKNKRYLKYESIFENGVLYRSRSSFTASDTFAVGDWEMVGSGGGDGTIGSFDPNKEYKKYQPVFVNSNIYRAKYDFQPALVFDELDWEIITTSGGAAVWAPGEVLKLGDTRKISDRAFSNTKARTSGTLMNADEFKNWTPLTPLAGWIIWTGTVNAPARSNAKVPISIIAMNSSIFPASDKFDSAFSVATGIKISGNEVNPTDLEVTATEIKLLNGLWLEPGDTITLYFK